MIVSPIMNILLANIDYPLYVSRFFTNFKKSLSRSFPFAPITLPILAALTPKDYTIEIKDWCRYQDLNFDGDYDLIGLSFNTNYAIEAYKIADEFRRRGKTVVLGGWHSSALPLEAKQHSDAVVIGEAEETWPELLNDFKNKNLRQFYSQKKPTDPKKIPILQNYTKIETPGVQATRGCPYRCDFCSITYAKFGNIFRARPIEDVIKEIKSTRENLFVFYDNSLTINPSYTKELFKEMKSLNKKFTCYGNINVLNNDDELLKLSSEAGCKCWFIGFESVSQQSLESAGKKTNLVKNYISAVKKIHDYGAIVFGLFVFGFDYDKPDIFEKTKEFLRKSEIDFAQFHILTPYPGTPIFEKFEEQNRILTKDWSLYDCYNVVFKPRNMTPEQLYDNTKKVISEFYSYHNCSRRTFTSMKLLGSHNFIDMGLTNLKQRDDYRHLFKVNRHG